MSTAHAQRQMFNNDSIGWGEDRLEASAEADALRPEFADLFTESRPTSGSARATRTTDLASTHLRTAWADPARHPGSPSERRNAVWSVFDCPEGDHSVATFGACATRRRREDRPRRSWPILAEIGLMSAEIVGHWTVSEFFGDMRPPTEDDVPIALDGTRLDTTEKVVAYLREINIAREALEQRVG